MAASFMICTWLVLMVVPGDSNNTTTTAPAGGNNGDDNSGYQLLEFMHLHNLIMPSCSLQHCVFASSFLLCIFAFIVLGYLSDGLQFWCYHMILIVSQTTHVCTTVSLMLLTSYLVCIHLNLIRHSGFGCCTFSYFCYAC
jgi:hypothetical protein